MLPSDQKWKKSFALPLERFEISYEDGQLGISTTFIWKLPMSLLRTQKKSLLNSIQISFNFILD
ncbi:hypothetical protein ACTXT7_004151 [Hymenolepis weldensis]